METILEIKDLTKTYKNGRGIWDINLDIKKGDIFGFLGPNGAGKTTAMKIMTGLMKPDIGDVRIFGYSIIDQFEKAMSRVGCIIETAESYGYLSAYENLKLQARFYKNVDDKRIDEVLELTGILKFKNEKVRNFSLGMKQRIGIASAILSSPELIIMDEPLNGLDVEGMLEMRKLIKHMAETEKTSFFISSHLIHDVELTCNVIGIIFNGKMVNVDNIENILANYSSLENYFVSEVGKNGSV
ncbi:ABC transporter ATP-binding protein [Herbivorax sp. ANBcel31]|uniref:ABC transporter ATP-binding protein n=1 Tax=Herbivorax sp. ANBcel31 TaxID=3069754 RepID=UPI0027B2A238|nr:ABC transporter ATP-binding protein [Herbivorax sp. ANBcel31]MDQ2087788.1 ABC transporter ATP-binding protein [Herbivorax sp. ANBcel31]